MDKQIQPKKNKTRKAMIYGIPALILLAILITSLTRKKQVNLNRSDILIKEVLQKEFEDIVLFNSTVEPKTSLLINVIQGGSVAEIFAENGSLLKKGDPLLKIYNPNAELNYLTQETAIVEQINNLRNIRVNIKNQQLNLNEQLLSIDNAYKNAKRQYLVDSTLYSKDALARLDYEGSQQEYKYQKERSLAIKKSVTQERKDREIQLSRVNVSINNMQGSLELLKKNKENFVIKAPADGLLSLFNPILGENYNQGQNIGKINKLDGYKLAATIDQFYSSKLQEHVKGSVTVNSVKYDVTISKVHPEVVGGQFEVELAFSKDSIPTTVKRGMTLKTKLFLSNSSKALVVSKGLFYTSTNGKWVFVLDGENKAVKRKVQIGRENPYYYEVLQGLKEGDKIITSSYDDMLDVETVNIK